MSNYTIDLSTIDSENIQIIDVVEEEINVADQDNVSIESEIVDTTNIEVNETKVFSDSNYNNLNNKPILNTNNVESLEPNTETIENTINLHKVSKTGYYKDLKGNPTKLSDFENDKDFADKQFVLDNSVGGKIDSISVNGDIIEPVNKNVNIETPTKISDLQNDLGFIDSTVDNLFNYYSKKQTYSKSEVNEIINNIHTFNALIVQSLPTQNISTTTIYLIEKTDTENNDYYDEYLYINNAWEMIGNTKIDLTNYYNKSQVDEIVSRETLSRETAINQIQSQINVLDNTKANQDDVDITINSLTDLINEKPNRDEIPTDYVNNSTFETNVNNIMQSISQETYIRETADNSFQEQINSINDTKADDNDVVHKTGNETISGTKTFSGSDAYYNYSNSLNNFEIDMFSRNKETGETKSLSITADNIYVRNSDIDGNVEDNLLYYPKKDGTLLTENDSYQLVETRIISNQSSIEFPVDLNTYEYKIKAFLAKSGGTANISCWFAQNGNILTNLACRWIYGRFQKITSSSGAGTYSSYAYQIEENGYAYITDVQNNASRYWNIDLDIYRADYNTDRNAIFKSNATYNYAGYQVYCDASSHIYSYPNTDGLSIVMTNAELDTNQILKGVFKIYRRKRNVG